MGPRAAGGDADGLVVIPPRPRRGPPRRAGRRGRVRAGLRWTTALTALVLVGALAAVLGWRELAGDAARDGRPDPDCVARAVEQAQDFAAVLGDTRPVAPGDVERSCVARP